MAHCEGAFQVGIAQRYVKRVVVVNDIDEVHKVWGLCVKFEIVLQ